MTKPDLTFVICTERGFLEKMSVLFVMSLRVFGGRFANCKVISYQPRRGYDLSNKTLELFDELNVVHKSLPLNEEYIDYPLANKPLACAHAEKICDTEILVFADSDQLILKEPSAFLLDDNTDILLRPVDVKNVGATDEYDPNYPYWKKLYDTLTVVDFRYVNTTVDQQRILAYWNSGLIVTRRRNLLFDNWERNFRTVMSKKIKPDDGIFFVEQSVLSATICSGRYKVGNLPNDYNYPVHVNKSIGDQNRIDKLSELTTIHYHKIFDNNPPDHPLKDLMVPGKLSKGVNRLLRHSGVYAPSLSVRIKESIGAFSGFS